MAIVMAAGLLMQAIPANAAHRPQGSLAIVEQEYEEEEYIIEEDEDLSEESLTPYRAAVYTPGAGDFLYPKLTAGEKKVYAALWAGAQEPEKDAYVPFETYTCTAQDKASARAQDPVTADEKSRAAYAVIFDHPEIYWAQNIRILYSYVIKGNSYTVTVKVKFAIPSISDFSAGRARLSARADALLSGIDKSAPEAVIALKIHDALAQQVTYDYEEENAYGHSAYGALVDGSAVCDGYAKAYKYLLGKYGIEASVLSSHAHAWNIVKLGGRYYETDVTWDDEEHCMKYYDLSTAQMDDGYFHERNNASTSRYIPRAEGGKFTSQYMSFCGKVFSDAGPAGSPASLSVISGGKDDDLWSLDILDAQGTSLKRSIHKAASSAGSFNIRKELSSESSLEAARIYGVKTGTYDISTRVVYDNGAVSSFRAAVTISGKAHTQSVDVSPASMTMEKGASAVLSARVLPSDSTDPVQWTSSAPGIAAVDGTGNIRALAKGNAVITASSGGHSASCSVTVKITPTGISAPSKMDLIKGQTASAGASMLPDGAEGIIEWKSSNAQIAAVTSDGKIKGVSTGSCTVTGTVKGTSVKAVINISVALAEPVLQAPAVTSTGLKLTWAKVTGASAYRVYRKAEGGDWTARTVTAKQTWTDTAVESGKKYAYAVACLASDRKKELSSYGLEPAEARFYAPVKVSLSNTAAGLQASWNSLPGISTYRIYYANGNTWKKVCDVEGTSYVFKGLASGTTRKVKVRAVLDEKLASGSSNTPSLRYIKAPDVKTLSKVSSRKIKVTWNKSAGAAKYRVFCKEGNGQWKKLGDTASLSYTWSSAKKGKTYTFRVCCVSGNGKTVTSAYGTEKSVKR